MQKEIISMDIDFNTANSRKIILLDVIGEVSNPAKRHRSNEIPVTKFNDDDECETYIRHNKGDDITLIINGSSTSDMLDKFHNLQPIKAIYVRSNTDDSCEKRMVALPKVRSVSMDSSIDELIDRISNSERRRNYWMVPLAYDKSPIDASNNEEYSSTEIDGGFLHSQLLLDSLITLKSNEVDTSAEITYFREKYSDDASVLAKINDFESNYSANNSLFWYTQDSFFYRILNRAFRVQDIDALYTMRRFIRDLHDQLIEQQQRVPCSYHHVYRGQCIAKSEFEDFTVGELISMNSFVSTTMDRNNALFLLAGATPTTEIVPILFEIMINEDVSKSKFFANIAEKSAFPSELEVLFMPGNIFRITDIVIETDGISTINLVLCSDDDHDLKQLFEYMRNDIPPDSLPFAFGICLANSGKFEKAERFFRKVLSEMSDDDPLIMDIYHQLGNVLDDCGQFEESFEYYEKALTKKLQIFASDDPRIANTYTCCGAAYQRKSDFNHALEFYEKALEIYKQAYGNEDKDVAMCLDNMANIKMFQKDFDESIRLHKEALKIWTATLPENHPDIARAHIGIAEILIQLELPDEALEHYKRALIIAQRSLPPRHPDLTLLYDGVGKLYFSTGDNDLAEEYFEDSLAIKKILYSSDHQEFADSYHNLALICKHKSDFQQALSLLEQASAIQNRYYSEDHEVSIRLLNDLAETRAALEKPHD